MKQDVTVELFYGGDWHEATAYARDPIVITRGRADRSQAPVPASATLTLDNRSGDYNPRNPTSPLFGLIGRNTPLRIGLTRAAEGFEDASLDISVANGGNAAWARASDQAHSGTWSFKSGSISHSQTSDAIVSVPAGAREMTFWYRVSSEEDFDELRVLVDASQELAVSGEVDWTGVTLNVAGASTVTLRYRKDGSASDGDDAAWVDDIRFSDPRFYGEVASWKPDRAIKGDAWTEIEAAGVLRRLGQGRDPRAATHRAILGGTNSVLAYWPLDDTDGAAAAHSAVAGVDSMRPVGTSQYQAPVTGAPIPPAGLPRFGSGLTPAGSKPGISLTEGGRLDGSVPPSPVRQWEVHFDAAFALDAAGVLACEALWVLTESEGGPDKWIFNFDTQLTVFIEEAGSVVGTLVAAFDPYDGAAHHYGLVVDENGSQLDAWLYVDGEQVDSDGFVSQPFAPVDKIVVNGLEDTGDHMPIGLANVAVFAPYLGNEDIREAVHWAAHGHPGETAGNRVARLCEEEGVAFASTGDLDDSAAMGPQGVGTVLELLAECERTDDGVLYEAPDVAGLHYRTGRSLVNVGSALTLDFDAGEVAPPMRPVIDDLDVWNDVTASRPDGATVRVTRHTGPLNTQPPEDDPQGIGRYATQLSVNPQTEFGLAVNAGWELAKGGVDETRYPQLTVDLDANPALAVTVGAIVPGDELHISNLEADGVELLVTQTVEEIGSHRRRIIFAGSSARPYRVVELDDGELAFLSSGASTVAADFDAGTDTALSVSVASGNPGWDDADAPYDVMAAGVRLTVTAVSGSGPYTLTVTQAPVNGVIKTIPAGSEVDIYPAAYVGM